PSDASPLPLHDALPISCDARQHVAGAHVARREADLDEVGGEERVVARHAQVARQGEREPATDGAAVDRGDDRLTRLAYREHQLRSEEHTSELQSRENLV